MPTRPPRIAALLSAVLLAVGATGCGPDAGALLYHSGLIPQEKVAAEFKLPGGPLLILVDDDLDLIRPAQTREMLVDELAKSLREHTAVTRVTTNEELARVRQQEPEFDKTAADAVGRLVNADTVLWLSTKEYAVSDNLELAVSPGRFAVNVKILNAKAETRDDVRLWPEDREGKTIEAAVSPHDIRQCRTKTEVHELMAAALADEVARLFYERTIEK